MFIAFIKKIALTIVDNFSRFSLGIRFGKSIKGVDVVEVLEALKNQRQLKRKRIQVNNGSEFISKDLDKWAYNKINDYNYYRLHNSLNELTPAEYVAYYQNKMIKGEILPEATDD